MNWNRYGGVTWMAAIALIGGCGAGGESVNAGSSKRESGKAEADRRVAMVPVAGESLRVGGDLFSEVSGVEGDLRAGPCRIDTPLPVGYPMPTPPGAIEVKTYPSVRRAEVRGTGSADRGMNGAFWPLFNHIKKHDIAMTSPVEMEYGGESRAGEVSSKLGRGGAWSMAFLYRTAEQNATGTEGEVVVRDAEPVTVVAIGMKGDYGMKLVERGAKEIEDWLAANPEWEAAGGWRSLYYNGPSLDFWNKWAEVQIPVRARR